MTLTIKERLLLTQVLPVNEPGRIASLRIRGKFYDDLTFSEEEHKMLSIKRSENGSQIAWDPTAPQESEIDAGPVVIEWVAATLKRMESAEPPTLTRDFMTLWDKFGCEAE